MVLSSHGFRVVSMVFFIPILDAGNLSVFVGPLQLRNGAKLVLFSRLRNGFRLAFGQGLNLNRERRPLLSRTSATSAIFSNSLALKLIFMIAPRNASKALRFATFSLKGSLLE